MLKRQFTIVILVAVVILSAGIASADYIERECALISDKFDRVRQSLQMETQLAIAVIPFTSRLTDLQQRNIGFGVSELLTGSLVNKRTFTVLERSQIEKVLSEQKLSLTGLTADSALKVGELAGAKLIVMGTVDKIGENYRINCRLVSAENGTVLASHLSDFRIDEFEKKAKDYIVPKKEAMGAYLGWRIIPITRVTNSPVSIGGCDYKNAVVSSDRLSSVACYGNRFYVSENLVFDLSFAKTTSRSQVTIVMTGGSGEWTASDQVNCADVILTASRAIPLNPKMDIFLGTGINYLSIASADYTRAFPLVSASFEWRPWQRVGFSLWAYYRFGSTDVISLRSVQNRSILPMPIFQLDPLSIMPVVSFYF